MSTRRGGLTVVGALTIVTAGATLATSTVTPYCELPPSLSRTAPTALRGPLAEVGQDRVADALNALNPAPSPQSKANCSDPMSASTSVAPVSASVNVIP